MIDWLIDWLISFQRKSSFSFRSQQFYCSVIWHSIKAFDRRKLAERIQEKALRAIYRDTASSYEKLLTTTGLPTMLNRRLQDIAILTFKVKNNLWPQYIIDLFKRQQSNFNLRNIDFVINDSKIQDSDLWKTFSVVFGFKTMGQTS